MVANVPMISSGLMLSFYIKVDITGKILFTYKRNTNEGSWESENLQFSITASIITHAHAHIYTMFLIIQT